VLISAFVFGGIPEATLKKVFSEAKIWVSPQLLEEYREIPFELEARGKITPLQLKSLVSGIASFVVNAKVVTPKKKLSICRDPEDNMILECCFAADADFLITGDKDLLEIKKTRLKTRFPKLRIISPRFFLEHKN
jgi:putative PIN family toxin of toxin-antitoxin system